jgi:hypothetical protein
MNKYFEKQIATIPLEDRTSTMTLVYFLSEREGSVLTSQEISYEDNESIVMPDLEFANEILGDIPVFVKKEK